MKYSRAEWEAQREVIVELYSHSDLNLTEIVQIMADEHEFDATEAMFKKHLYRWGVFKNMVGNQRKQLVRIALAHYHSGICLPAEDGEGRKIPWDRVKRSCLRNGQHVTMWRNLAIPQRRKGKSPAHSDQSTPEYRQKSAERQSIQHGLLETRDLRQPTKYRSSSRSNAIQRLLRHSPTISIIQPRSSTYLVDCILSYIPVFQSWRASAVANSCLTSSPTARNDDIDTKPSAVVLGNTNREDSAMNIINDFFDLARHLHLGSNAEARACFNSARAHFNRYLRQPSYFLIYAVLVIHILPASEDRLLQTWKSMLIACFYNSCQTRLGDGNPLTRILRQLVADTTSISSSWRIAILACIANTADLLACEASKFTSIIIRHGLALALCAHGYHYSAISVLKDVAAEAAAFKHPALRKVTWSHFHLAEIYQLEGMYDEARAVLEQMTISTAQAPGGRLLCCYSVFGKDLHRFHDSYWIYRRLYEASCNAYGKDGPLTAVYAQMFQDFLCRLGIDMGDKCDDYNEVVSTMRVLAHWRLKESPRRLITFASAGIS